MNNFSYEFFPKIIVLTLCIFSKIACAEINLNIPNTDQFKLSKTSSIQDYKLQADDSYKLSNRPLTNKKISEFNKKLPFDKEVLSAAQETQMEPALIHAIMTVESNYN